MSSPEKEDLDRKASGRSGHEPSTNEYQRVTPCETPEVQSKRPGVQSKRQLFPDENEISDSKKRQNKIEFESSEDELQQQQTQPLEGTQDSNAYDYSPAEHTNNKALVVRDCSDGSIQILSNFYSTEGTRQIYKVGRDPDSSLLCDSRYVSRKAAGMIHDSHDDSVQGYPVFPAQYVRDQIQSKFGR